MFLLAAVIGFVHCGGCSFIAFYYPITAMVHLPICHVLLLFSTVVTLYFNCIVVHCLGHLENGRKGGIKMFFTSIHKSQSARWQGVRFPTITQ